MAQQAPTSVYKGNNLNTCSEWGNSIMGGRERARHIDICKHFAHEANQDGHMLLVCVLIAHQLANIVTKGLHAQ
jgi:hypothetical protein